MISVAPLRRIMAERDMTIEFLSQASGINLNTMKKIMTGQSITNENISTLCELLKVQPHEIIEYQKSETKGHWEWVEN